MGYTGQFLSTVWALLLFLDRLRVSRLVRAESTIVCCHVELRVIFTSLRRPFNLRLRAVVIRVRIPSALIASMKPSTIARCAIANELLRRKNQTPCDKIVCPGSTSKHHINLLSISVEQLPVSEARSGKKQQRALEELPSTVQHGSSLDTTNVQTGAPANPSTPKSKSQHACTQYLHHYQPHANVKVSAPP
jgi:hypothetical protein